MAGLLHGWNYGWMDESGMVKLWKGGKVVASGHKGWGGEKVRVKRWTGQNRSHCSSFVTFNVKSFSVKLFCCFSFAAITKLLTKTYSAYTHSYPPLTQPWQKAHTCTITYSISLWIYLQVHKHALTNRLTIDSPKCMQDERDFWQTYKDYYYID